VGFNWRGGKWVGVQFRAEKFVVKKVNFSKSYIESTDIKVFDCTYPYLRTDPAYRDGSNDPRATRNPMYGSLRNYPACVSVQDEESGAQHYMYCSESHNKRDGKWAVTLECAKSAIEWLKFAPDGPFHKAAIGSYMPYTDKDKVDSQLVAVGSCRRNM